MPLKPSTAVAPHERLTFPLDKDFNPDDLAVSDESLITNNACCKLFLRQP
ncbi:hypothetical protein [Nostoc sp.]